MLITNCSMDFGRCKMQTANLNTSQNHFQNSFLYDYDHFISVQ
jgi:hypothetical protein